jgi:hypothetical protein
VHAALRAITRDSTPETIAAEIAAAEAEAREAGAEAAHQAALAETELEDRTAEAALARSRAEDRRRRRAEVRVVELRERLTTTQWEERNRAFRQHRRKLAELSRKVIATMEAAVQANDELRIARHAALGEIGAVIEICPPPYLGLCLPDLFRRWRAEADSRIDALGRTELPKPPAPRPVPSQRRNYTAAEVAPLAEPLPALFLHGGVPFHVPRNPPPAAAPAPVAEAAPPAPAPRPRQPLREGPAGEGQRQVHILGAGFFDLGDGRTVVMGDRVNLPEWQAKVFVERGVADFAEVSDEVPSAPVTEPEPARAMEMANG